MIFLGAYRSREWGAFKFRTPYDDKSRHVGYNNFTDFAANQPVSRNGNCLAVYTSKGTVSGWYNVKCTKKALAVCNYPGVHVKV